VFFGNIFYEICFVAVFHQNNISRSGNSSSKQKCQRLAAANKDKPVIKPSASPVCSSDSSSTQPLCPAIVSTFGSSLVSNTIRALAAHGLLVSQVPNTADSHCQLPPSVLPTAVGAARHSAVAGRLASPLVPRPCLPSSTSTAYSTVSSHISQQPVTVVNGTQSKQLPVYVTPDWRPNAVPRPAGYVVPIYQPGGPQPGLSPRAAVCHRGGMFAGNSNGSQQMPMPAAVVRYHLPPPCLQRNGLPPVQTCMPSAPCGVVPPPACHVSPARNDLTPISSSFTAVQPGIVTNGSSEADVSVAVHDMALSEKDFSLLQDAMNEERAALQQNVSGDHSVAATTSNLVETSLAETDSLSDWSIIELPSPAVQDQSTVSSSSPPPLMHFSLDSELSRSNTSSSSYQDLLPFPVCQLSPGCIPQPGSVRVSVDFVYIVLSLTVK